eukprot:12423703-Karenia_brevis.AAC.1
MKLLPVPALACTSIRRRCPAPSESMISLYTRHWSVKPPDSDDCSLASLSARSETNSCEEKRPELRLPNAAASSAPPTSLSILTMSRCSSIVRITAIESSGRSRPA